MNNPPTDPTAYVEVLARLLCAADVHVHGDDHPTWQQLVGEPGQSIRDDYRKAAGWLASRLTVTPPPAVPSAGSEDTTTTRADALREVADRFDAMPEAQAPALRKGITWATSELRRLAAETQPSEAPWATDGARIGRVLIWSWARVGDTDFGQGYRTAQEDVRAILTRPLLGAEEQPESEPDAPRREPHPTEADLRHALAVAAKFHGQNTDGPAVVSAVPPQPEETNDRG